MPRIYVMWISMFTALTLKHIFITKENDNVHLLQRLQLHLVPAEHTKQENFLYMKTTLPSLFGMKGDLELSECLCTLHPM